jgi:hypothetical protein
MISKLALCNVVGRYGPRDAFFVSIIVQSVFHVNQKIVACLYNLNSGLNNKSKNISLLQKSFVFFTRMVDELVQFSDSDPELAEGIKWLDAQAQKKGITFYEMVFQVLYKHDISSRAKQWIDSRN